MLLYLPRYDPQNLPFHTSVSFYHGDAWRSRLLVSNKQSTAIEQLVIVLLFDRGTLYDVAAWQNSTVSSECIYNAH